MARVTNVIDKLEAPTPTLPSPAKLAAAASNAMAKVESDTQQLHARLRAEPKVSISLAPMYRPYFGNVMAVGLGCIPIYVPVDGRQYSVPKSYACIIQDRRRRVDDYIMRKNRMGNVTDNFERYAGELKL